MASRALFAVGISLEEMRHEAGEAFDMSLPEGRKLPLSPQAKNALAGRKEMRRLGDDGYLGTEHVLLGILAVEDGTAMRMLAGLGTSKAVVEERLSELRGRAAG